jgi:hypothetical protein
LEMTGNFDCRLKLRARRLFSRYNRLDACGDSPDDLDATG